jgi:hypothetical protein
MRQLGSRREAGEADLTVAGNRSRKAAAAAGTLLATCLVLAGCAPSAQRLTVRPAQGSSAAVPAPPSASAAATTSVKATPPAPLGTPGTFRVRRLQLTFTEPPRTGPSGESLGRRMLITQLWYPGGRRLLPLILFAPGFQQCATPYGDLLSAWASAGYVVAGVDFPHSDCKAAGTATENDMINQPGDMSYVLTRLLALSQRSGGAVSGLIDRREVAAAGQSDGGDTVAALAANTCCEDGRLAAVAVLSGAEWAPMPGRYFAGTAPPMLFVQGSADTVNPPWKSVQLYQADNGIARYYLDLFGADHTGPYWGTNKTEQIVVRVTVAFFDRYVLGRKTALALMTRDGNVTGNSAIVAAGTPVPSG